MLQRVVKLFRCVYNKVTRDQHTVEPTHFGEWYTQTEEFRKLNLTTMPEALDALFNEGVNYYG